MATAPLIKDFEEYRIPKIVPACNSTSLLSQREKKNEYHFEIFMHLPGGNVDYPEFDPEQYPPQPQDPFMDREPIPDNLRKRIESTAQKWYDLVDLAVEGERQFGLRVDFRPSNKALSNIERLVEEMDALKKIEDPSHFTHSIRYLEGHLHPIMQETASKLSLVGKPQAIAYRFTLHEITDELEFVIDCDEEPDTGDYIDISKWHHVADYVPASIEAQFKEHKNTILDGEGREFIDTGEILYIKDPEGKYLLSLNERKALRRFLKETKSYFSWLKSLKGKEFTFDFEKEFTKKYPVGEQPYTIQVSDNNPFELVAVPVTHFRGVDFMLHIDDGTKIGRILVE